MSAQLNIDLKEEKMSKDDKAPYDILFVEDEVGMRTNYVQYLQRFFRNVYEAGDGEEAYKIYQKKKPQILFVDINIPKLNGLELMRKIREHDHSCKAIILTAYSDESYLLESTELKLSKYLIKPISRQELRKTLDWVMQELDEFTTLAKEYMSLTENFYWDKEQKELLSGTDVVSLTYKEREFLTLIFAKANIVFSYENIIMDLWGDNEEGRMDALKTILKNLRKKLPKDTIKNVFGVGYKY